MTDPPGVPSALGIEAVEWFPHDGENLTVRITGRWRRRRPAWSGQPLLVIEAQGRRHRFPAMPEPPSLTGAAPGTWRMSFSVPSWLAPHLGGSAWLQLGAVVVPLPIEVEPAAAPAPEPAASEPDAPEPAASADPATSLESSMRPQPPMRGYELSLQAARRKAAEAEEAVGELASRIEQLELELQQARREPGPLIAQLAERERERRAAEQRAHAERVLREELQEELARRARERSEDAAATSAAAALEEHVHALETEIEDLRRKADEAEQFGAASRAARELAERELVALMREREQSARGPGAAQTVASGLRAELAIAERSPPAAPAAASGLVELPEQPLGLRPEREMIASRSRLPSDAAGEEGSVAAARLELEARTASDGRARAMLAAAQDRLDARSVLDRKLSFTLTELREELAELRTIAERESAGRAEAQARAAMLERELRDYETRFARAYDAIEDLRGRLEAVVQTHAGGSGALERDVDAARAQLAPADPPPAQPAAVEPERLAAALARLREAAPAEPASDPEVGAVGGPARPPAERPEPAERPQPAERAEHPATGWLRRVFRALTERDGAAAGRLALALLPAQRLVDPVPLAYDLVLADAGCVQVTEANGSVRVEQRPLEQVQFQVTGDLASLARLLAAGRIRRRFGRGLARVRGDRSAFNTLVALVRAPLHLRELYAAGVRMEPRLSLSVVALMIDPSWTKGERFTIAHRVPGATSRGAYLQVLDGEPPSVTDTPADSVATTIVCPPDSLLPVLDGAARTDTVLLGEERPLTLLQSWVKRAQSG